MKKVEKKKVKKERKTGIVVMLSKDDHLKLKKLAKKDGRSESGYMRKLLLNAK